MKDAFTRQYFFYIAQSCGIKQNLFLPFRKSRAQIDSNGEGRGPGLTLHDFMGDMDIGVMELYSFVVCDRRHGEGDSTSQCPDDHINGTYI